MKKGDYVYTPRFLRVKIEDVFENELEARLAGYTESTHYWNDPIYGVYGKTVDMYHMKFAGFKKCERPTGNS